MTDFTPFERRIETLKKHLAETPLQAVTQWATHHLNSWDKYRDDGDLDAENTAMAHVEIIYWNTLLDILRDVSSAEQLLKDTLCVLNAHSVGYKTQKALERFLEKRL